MKANGNLLSEFSEHPLLPIRYKREEGCLKKKIKSQNLSLLIFTVTDRVLAFTVLSGS